MGLLFILSALILSVQPQAERAILLNKVPLKVGNEESLYLTLKVNASRPSYTLHIYLELSPYQVGPSTLNPLLNVALIDEDGLKMMERGEPPKYLYLRARALEKSTSFNLKNLNTTGTYYLVFSNALPEKAPINVSVMEEWF